MMPAGEAAPDIHDGWVGTMRQGAGCQQDSCQPGSPLCVTVAGLHGGQGNGQTLSRP